MMEYKQSKEFEEPSNKTNVIISAFCSTSACIKLWKMMKRLGNCVMYHDTDSIIYTYKLQEWIPPTGEYLGDLMDELSCSKIFCKGCKGGHWTVDFISCRAQNYAYKLNTGEVEEPSNKTNVIISAFCSAYTHIKLWKIMNRLGNHVLYHNMDSIIYTSHKNGFLLLENISVI